MPYKKNSSGGSAAANITSQVLSSSIDTTNPLLPKLKLKSVIDQSGTLISSNELLIDLEEINNTGSNTITTTDTSTIDFSGDGTTTTPLTALIKLSTTAGNSLITNLDGLYASTVSTAITSLPEITATTTIPAQTSAKVVLVKASSSTGLVEAILPLSSTNNNQPIYISRNDYNPSFIANIKSQGTDKIGNTTTYPMTTGSSIADTYMCIPVSGGWVIN